MQIVANNLGRRFGKVEALREVDFELHPGEIVAVVGDNGAGKSTLLQMLAGLLTPTDGSLHFDGEAFRRTDEMFRRKLVFLPDFPPFFPHHRVLEHCAMVSAFYGKDPEDAVELIEKFGILEFGNARMGTLSRGQLYKAVLAAVVPVHPELWLLDEPMASGMDPRGLGVLKEVLRSAAARGSTVIYSTQIPEIAEAFCDRILILGGGRLLALDSVEKIIRAQNAGNFTEALTRVQDAGHL